MVAKPATLARAVARGFPFLAPSIRPVPRFTPADWQPGLQSTAVPTRSGSSDGPSPRYSAAVKPAERA